MSQTEAVSNFVATTSSMLGNMWLYTAGAVGAAQIPLHIMAYVTRNNGKNVDPSKTILKNWTRPDKR